MGERAGIKGSPPSSIMRDEEGGAAFPRQMTLTMPSRRTEMNHVNMIGDGGRSCNNAHIYGKEAILQEGGSSNYDRDTGNDYIFLGTRISTTQE